MAAWISSDYCRGEAAPELLRRVDGAEGGLVPENFKGLSGRMPKGARFLGLIVLPCMLLACGCCGPCPSPSPPAGGTLARFERPVVLFGAHDRRAGYHVRCQSNRAVTVVFSNLQAELRPYGERDLQAVSHARLVFAVQPAMKEPFYARVRVDFRYAAAFSAGAGGGIRACMNGRRMVVRPALTSSRRYDAGTQSFEFTHLFLPGERGDLDLSLHAERGAWNQAARVGLSSLDVQLLVPPRMARRFKSNTRT